MENEIWNMENCPKVFKKSISEDWPNYDELLFLKTFFPACLSWGD